jgi:raffinose/stachyose/melibiose transport system substrate-binding protein
MGMKAAVTTAAAILMIWMLLSGCLNSRFNRQEPSEKVAMEEPSQPVTITLRHILVRDGSRHNLRMLQDVVAETEKAVPGLRIELEGVEDRVNRFQKLPVEMATRNAPDIFSLFGGTDTIKYAKAGRLLDVTPFLDELKLKDQFINLDEFTVDGKVYGLPTAGYVEGIYYNKKIFRDLGIPIPATWEQFLASCGKLKANGIVPLALGASDGWVANMMANTLWVRMAGPDVVERIRAGDAKWTDFEVAAAYKAYVTLIKEGYVQSNSLALSLTEAQNEFRTGKAAMIFDGTWASSSYLDPNTSAVSDFLGFMPFPAMGGPGDGWINGSWSSGYGFSSELSPEQLIGAKNFIRYMYSPQMQKRQLIETGALPAIHLQDFNAEMNPAVAEIMDVLQQADGLFPAFDSIVSAKVREALEQGTQALIGGIMPPEEMLRIVQHIQQDTVANEIK